MIKGPASTMVLNTSHCLCLAASAVTEDQVRRIVHENDKVFGIRIDGKNVSLVPDVHLLPGSGTLPGLQANA